MTSLHDIVNPVPSWDGTLWSGGHYYSGRGPSSGYFDPSVNSRPHLGVDLDCARGDEVVSAYDGTVYPAQFNSGAGTWLPIKSTHYTGRPFFQRHLHLLQVTVPPWTKVSAGQVVALANNTGASAGNHDHFELLWDQPYADWRQDKHIDVEYLLTGVRGRKGDDEMITGLQQHLERLGFDPGVVDGIYGPGTHVAWGAYMEQALRAEHNHRLRLVPKKVTGWVHKWRGLED